jgi:glucosylceramidase
MRATTVLIGLASAFVFALAVAPQTAHAQSASVWLTTDNLKKRLRQQAQVAFSTSTSGSNTIVVDESEVYQPIEGFGASVTDSSAYVLNEVATPAAREAAMHDLFTRDGNGIGLSFVRNPMGASDLARTHYSYDDLPAGETDPQLSSFSIAHDQADIIPLILDAKQLNPQLKIMATPWSAPGWMKTSDSMVGGSLLSSRYPAFADYLVKYVQAYAAAGITVDYVSLQNEPLYVPADYPGTSIDAATQTVILRDFVLPAFAANGVTTKVLVYDHNWDRPDYPDTVFADPTIGASEQVGGVAWHGYGGTPGAMGALHVKYPDKGVYETEDSGGAWVAHQNRTDFEIITECMRNWSRSFVKWGLALDQNRGPHAGGCGNCSPLVTVDTTTGEVSYTTDFYTLGQFSKFVLPGAHRVYSSNASGVVSAAFVNPDGSKVLVAFNDGKKKTAFAVQWGTKSFAYMLPGYAAATFTWSGTQDGGYTINAKSQIQASSFNTASGLQDEVTADTRGGYDVGYIDGGDYAVYRNVSFPAGLTAVDARVASAGSGGTLEFHLDSPTGPLVGSVTIPVTGDWQRWRTVMGTVTGASGVHDLYAVFKGASGIGNLNWFRFR